MWFVKRVILTTLLSTLACSSQQANIRVDQAARSSTPKVTVAKPGILKAYSAFYVAPITIYGQDQGRLFPATPNELEMLESKFKSKIIAALGSNFTQFNQPARGVAIIDIKITDIWSNSAFEALRPGILIPNNLGAGATMQADFYDSITNKKIATVWDSRSGERRGYFSGLGKWSGVEGAFDEWAGMLRQSIRPQSY